MFLLRALVSLFDEKMIVLTHIHLTKNQFVVSFAYIFTLFTFL